MRKLKKSFLAAAGVATIGLTSLTGVALASAAASGSGDTSSSGGVSSLVKKIADKFGLEQSDVQAVFDENRAERQAEMKERRTTALKQAVTDGKLTQAQADYLTKAWNEIESLRGSAGPGEETDATRTAIRDKMQALRAWEQEQNLDLRSITGLGGPGGHGKGGHGGGFGGPRDEGAAPSSGSSSPSGNSTTSSAVTQA